MFKCDIDGWIKMSPNLENTKLQETMSSWVHKGMKISLLVQNGGKKRWKGKKIIQMLNLFGANLNEMYPEWSLRVYCFVFTALLLFHEEFPIGFY